MRTTVCIAAAAAAIAGCAPVPMKPQRPTVMITVPFDKAQAEAMMKDGVNIVKGSAFMRQRGGGVVTCAGMEVVLTPATEYATKRIWTIYGSTTSGFSNSTNPPLFSPDVTDYKVLSKYTKCDAQGNFSFDRVADGEWYITTSVAWMAGSRLQGGNMMQKVQAVNGSISSVVLAY